MNEVLALANDALQATIVIFGSAVVLYNLRHFRRDRPTRAFSNLIIFVVIVYLTELLATRASAPFSREQWLRLEWVGIAMVPAALFHLADALLATTGHASRRRRLGVRVFYLTGLAFIGLVAASNFIVGGLVNVPDAPHLRAGPLFALFTIYFWAVTAVSIRLVWDAVRLSITTTIRRRMRMILLAFVAAPLGVFPYLLLSGNEGLQLTWLFWLVLILGNLIVGLMFGLLTYYLAYFGATSPDRVVRVRLFKFMARVPLAATLVLLVFVLAARASNVLGLPAATVQAFAVVATVIVVEWVIHAFKQPLERLFHLNHEPDVARIQELSERLLTTRDMQQFLESVLTTICETVRVPTAFVAAFTPDGPRLEVVIEPREELQQIEAENWRELTRPSTNGDDDTLETIGDFVIWQDYWIRTLYNRQQDALVGVLGIQARGPEPDLTDEEQVLFDRLVEQAAKALEDRILQQEVFAAVEGLLPEITALQKRRSALAYGNATLLTAPREEQEAALINDPGFSDMVKDALTHYWGGPKLTDSPLMRLQVVQEALAENKGNTTKAMRAILERAIEQQKPLGERSMTTAEWILYNILELKFIQGQRVRDVARRLAMSESDLYRKQRVALENVARTISTMELQAVRREPGSGQQGPIGVSDGTAPANK